MKEFKFRFQVFDGNDITQDWQTTINADNLESAFDKAEVLVKEEYGELTEFGGDMEDGLVYDLEEWNERDRKSHVKQVHGGSEEACECDWPHNSLSIRCVESFVSYIAVY